MTDKEKIKTILELFIAWNGETEVVDVANLDSAVDFIADSLQEESYVMGKTGKFTTTTKQHRKDKRYERQKYKNP